MSEKHFHWKNDWLLYKFDQQFVEKGLKYVPSFIQTNHLTLMTLIFCVLAIVSGYLAIHDIHWIWLFSLAIIFQYITDMLDGAVGRQRNTGLIKWGFYMDHLLDFIFLGSVFISYYFLLPLCSKYLSLIGFLIFGTFMVHSFLFFSITNEFKISYCRLGSTELRVIGVIINTTIAVSGKEILPKIAPVLFFFACIILIITVVKTHKLLFLSDLGQKTP